MEAQLNQVPSSTEARVLGEFARLHLLPESYIYGFAHVLFNAKSFNSYAFGKAYLRQSGFTSQRNAGEVEPNFLDILLVISIWVIASGRLQKWRELAFLVIPALIYLAASMLGGMNIGIRHILPVYIFLAILIAGATSVLVKSRRHWLHAVVLLLLFQQSL